MNIIKILQSRTVIVIILTFIVNGVAGITQFIPVDMLPIVNAVLGLIAVYFRITPRIKFDK